MAINMLQCFTLYMCKFMRNLFVGMLCKLNIRTITAHGWVILITAHVWVIFSLIFITERMFLNIWEIYMWINCPLTSFNQCLCWFVQFLGITWIIYIAGRVCNYSLTCAHSDQKLTFTLKIDTMVLIIF